MVRAPCCDKVGLKKGPWTTQEDQILTAYVLQHGHGNWRALPKQAGLLRCGKSCRLRWINYLRPDIKRGNFSREEEDTIIELHEKLGNKWSAIAASLPGRTDNEIKNVWHTHLKKRLKKKLATPDSKGHFTAAASTCDSDSFNSSGKMSPQPSSSEFSSFTDSSTRTMETHSTGVKNEQMEEYSTESFPEIDESFWSDALSSDNSSMASDFPAVADELQLQTPELAYGQISNMMDDGMEFWYDVFIRSGGLQEL
ncbi:hypothetical protein VitviT2T_006720 [Vitis vinifera]|uniref:Transcription factor MYB15 n=2 Tax=Vitis vinifera TaxID=29760 RepID=A0A438DDA4_VITVI|nr:transcription factor MYB15 [Vitis vinifera]AHA83524.1 R2R3 MYB15 transcription factor [Vitis vinifera]ASU52609.1 MYB15 [Vitis vinifera]RVW33371.1 Transcription factor MYB15 [Vitis vinifera]WJZ87331.1 hypothetical protein VitviT2T_006720 [Vitis vinifera]CAN63580.1 hypothetical protein VITISV_029015 [Vitis vinifera]|eukprot:XP_002285193.1 PREDICTED: myb-related protein Myb4 [Vitis vinifera]